jgi:hypothetical protein
METRVHSAYRPTFDPIRDCPSELVGQDRARLALAGLFLSAGPILLAYRMVAEAQDGRCSEGPRERGVAELRTGGALALAGGCLGPCDAPAGGHAIRHPGATSDSMDGLPEHETQDLASARDRLEPVQGVGILRLGRRHKGHRQVPQPLILRIDQGAGDCEALLHGGSRAPRRHTGAVGWLGDLCPTLGHMVLTGGLLDMRQPCRPFPHEMDAPPPQGAGSAHGCGRAIRLGAHASPQPHSHFWGIDCVIVGLPPMESLPREGMPEHQWHPCAGTQVGQPLPRDDADDTDDTSRPRRGDSLEKGVWSCWQMPVDEHRPISVEDTEEHGAGVSVDTPRTWGRWGVQSPEVSSALLRASLPLFAYHQGMLGSGPQ